MKGITLDKNNSSLFTFDSIKKMVLTQDEIKSAERHQFLWDSKTKDVYTRQISRTVQPTMETKRIVLEDHNSVPFGFKICK